MNIKTSVVGFPRIGEKRELKFALEDYWKGKISFDELSHTAKLLRKKHWEYQKEAGISYISINDFSFYDNILDTVIMLGVEPNRFKHLSQEHRYFAMARGNKELKALEMTKWFNTNYHYLVPELSQENQYKIDITKIKNEYQEAKELGITPKINIIGLITFLKLSKTVDKKSDPLEFFDIYLKAYVELVNQLKTLDDEIIIQFEEPYFVQDVQEKELQILKKTYETLSNIDQVKIIVATYFEHSNEANKMLCQTNIYGLALDLIHGKENQESFNDIANSGKVLFAGVIDGRNIWICDLKKQLERLQEITKIIDPSKLVLSTSCSLLHVPYKLSFEDSLEPFVKSSLSFALEKLDELQLLSKLFDNRLTDVDKDKLKKNQKSIQDRKTSVVVNNKEIQERVKNLKESDYKRKLAFNDRIAIQKKILQYPDLATTTIGSFPQTKELRAKRLSYKKGEISQKEYEAYIEDRTRDCIKLQEEIGLDVLVHGEFERNDMVEYFGEKLNGFVFSSNAWVQSYGSRCVKPPIIYGDVNRAREMTVRWSKYAQSLTDKVMKGMLTGPVTIMNWSFVRDDKTRNEVCKQIALSIRDEIDELQKNGIRIIQVDEAAFKEGYPLRKKNIPDYEKFALNSFLLATAVAANETQIHTHMCYSEFNDIIKTIESMDADVISIETARSGNELLKIFKKVGYKQEVGPGVYDIHSPRIPSKEELKEQIKSLLEVLPKEKLWINPDCGLKTRDNAEVKPSLKNMVKAVQEIRQAV